MEKLLENTGYVSNSKEELRNGVGPFRVPRNRNFYMSTPVFAPFEPISLGSDQEPRGKAACAQLLVAMAKTKWPQPLKLLLTNGLRLPKAADRPTSVGLEKDGCRWAARVLRCYSLLFGFEGTLTRSPSSALSHPFFRGRVPLLKYRVQKKGTLISNLSTGGPSQEGYHFCCCCHHGAIWDLSLSHSLFAAVSSLDHRAVCVFFFVFCFFLVATSHTS